MTLKPSPSAHFWLATTLLLIVLMRWRLGGFTIAEALISGWFIGANWTWALALVTDVRASDRRQG